MSSDPCGPCAYQDPSGRIPDRVIYPDNGMSRGRALHRVREACRVQTPAKFLNSAELPEIAASAQRRVARESRPAFGRRCCADDAVARVLGSSEQTGWLELQFAA